MSGCRDVRSAGALRSLVAGLVVAIAAVVQAAGGSAPSVIAAQPDAGWVVEGEPGCDRVALIFNVGSGYEPATAILDTLAEEGAPATFFVMGWWAEQNPALLQRLFAGGFVVGSHGYLPPELTIRDDGDVAADVAAADAAIAAAGGRAADPWFTPFAGASDERVRALVASQGYTNVGWKVQSADWDPDATAESVYDNVMRGIYDGGIVELHLDASTSVSSTAEALPWIIRDLEASGYRLVTVPEMAGPCPSRLRPRPEPAAGYLP